MGCCLPGKKPQNHPPGSWKFCTFYWPYCIQNIHIVPKMYSKHWKGIFYMNQTNDICITSFIFLFLKFILFHWLHVEREIIYVQIFITKHSVLSCNSVVFVCIDQGFVMTMMKFTPQNDKNCKWLSNQNGKKTNNSLYIIKIVIKRLEAPFNMKIKS